VVGIDTSGSIVDEAPEFLAEVQSICEECKPESITVIQCDARVSDVREYEPGDTLSAEIRGGGGTDMREIYKHPALAEAPAIMVLLTDGFTPWGDDPGFPHITVTTAEPCPYGDNIKMVL
jgi:predicted metal-dependent peptidase